MTSYDRTSAESAGRVQMLIERSSLGEEGPALLRRRAARSQIVRIRALLDQPPPGPGGTNPRHRARRAGGPALPVEIPPESPVPGVELRAFTARAATELASVERDTVRSVIERVLTELVQHLDIDFAYVRRIDRQRQATVLIAEWPPRSVPDPDPLDVVYFDQAHSPFRAVQEAVEPTIRHVDSYSDQQVTSAVVPLLIRGASLGVLGLVKHGQWMWDGGEIDALVVIASLLAQQQARLEAESQVQYAAVHDDLTGLLNQHALMGYLQQRLRPGWPEPVATLFISVDRLTIVNNHLGRAAGDEVLRTIAARLKQYCERTDVVARFGHGEFVVVPAKAMDTVSAEFTAARIRQVLAAGIPIDGRSVSCGVSVGVAVATRGEVPAVVLRRADQALRAAKTQDGSGVAVFTDALFSQYDLHDDVTLLLHSAVSDDSLLLHYQPEVDLRTGRVLAVEALVRWQHPTRGLLPPDTFIGVAEATNLAGELGDWVIRAACAQLADWRHRGVASEVTLRINVSPMQLGHPDFVDSVESALMRHAIDGRFVCLEITENAALQDLPRTRMVLQALKRLHLQIAIDDFGTGYNTLPHLKALPLDAVKIDRSFVKVVNDSASDRAIIEAIVGLAGKFGLDVVGEGVETAAAARTLVALGCNRAQGFLITPPLPAAEVEQHLAAGSIAIPGESRAPR
ncbi:putative bifunctional diguanylate cyclase/phosphodiesterase [Nocardia asteroides]|uniref:putative bifunctional diguanylate cyclase/phosphodiesterase n=1 Tax=Nocardia asteroides TaxID=1824 RepID=UPI001E289678|nr:GGDEF domain-containing protein [Nocardia asteroides]UGT59115.1 GGDEF domain-containing protein [Nocardia asteroides]